MGRSTLGPGPGKYLLPPLVGYKNHDPSRYRNPQYSMGARSYYSKRDLGPGPKYNVEHMTPYGKDQPPAFSLIERWKDLKQFQGPGPAAYNIQNVPRMKEARPPAYSMVSRHPDLKTFKKPAPNTYDLPTTIGPKVPNLPVNGAFSMSPRYPLIDKKVSPGPARYDPTPPNKYKNRPPIYSMPRQFHFVGDRGTYPGPNNYYPKFAPGGGFSFGLKTDNAPYITPQDEMPCINK